MALTRDFKKTVVARVERDPAFAKALLDEAATLFLSDEPETARDTSRSCECDAGFRAVGENDRHPQ